MCANRTKLDPIFWVHSIEFMPIDSPGESGQHSVAALQITLLADQQFGKTSEVIIGITLAQIDKISAKLAEHIGRVKRTNDVANV